MVYVHIAVGIGTNPWNFQFDEGPQSLDLSAKVKISMNQQQNKYKPEKRKKNY